MPIAFEKLAKMLCGLLHHLHKDISVGCHFTSQNKRIHVPACLSDTRQMLSNGYHTFRYFLSTGTLREVPKRNLFSGNLPLEWGWAIPREGAPVLLDYFTAEEVKEMRSHNSLHSMAHLYYKHHPRGKELLTRIITTCPWRRRMK